ncbi:hypothetical protein BGZ73_007888 [Actinomortierella ambigua]|nr:hypothetical protein BGZ73_007888 [Actinomortierella ambigua]
MAKKKVTTKKQRSANSYRTNSKPSSVSPSTASSPSPQLQDPVVSVRRRKGTPVRSPSHNDTSKGIVFSFRIQPDSEMTMAVDIRSYDQQLRDDDDVDADHDHLEPTPGTRAATAVQERQQALSGGALRASASTGATRGVVGASPSGTANLKELQLQQQPHSANHTLPAPTTLATTTAASGHSCDNNNVLPTPSSLSSSPSSSAPPTSFAASGQVMTVAEWEQVGPGSSGNNSSLTRVAGGEWSNNLWSYRENNVMDLSRNLLVLHARRPPCRSWTTGSTPSTTTTASSCSSSSSSSAGLKSRTQQRALTSLFHPYSKNSTQSSSSSSSSLSASQSLSAAASPTSSSSMPSTPALSSAASSASASPASSPSSPTLCQSPERDYLTGGGKGDPLLEGVVAPLLADAPAPLNAIPSELLAKSKSRFLTVRGLGGGRGQTRMEVIVVS